jgi:hypothetical protein
MATLNNFLQNSTIASSMSIDGTYNLPANGMDVNSVQSGAYIPMKCNPGYSYAGGQLNITCAGTMWSTFPACLSTSGSAATTAMAVPSTMPPSTTTPCVVDQATTFNITNGYSASSSLAYTASNLATGNSNSCLAMNFSPCPL